MEGEGAQSVRKAMIITGMAKITNELWEKSQLILQLQAIIYEHNSVFSAALSKHIASD